MRCYFEMDVQVRAGGWARYVKKFLNQDVVASGFEFAGSARSKRDVREIAQNLPSIIPR
jgi:hypothetical protein